MPSKLSRKRKTCLTFTTSSHLKKWLLLYAKEKDLKYEDVLNVLLRHLKEASETPLYLASLRAALVELDRDDLDVPQI